MKSRTWNVQDSASSPFLEVPPGKNKFIPSARSSSWFVDFSTTVFRLPPPFLPRTASPLCTQLNSIFLVGLAAFLFPDIFTDFAIVATIGCVGTSSSDVPQFFPRLSCSFFLMLFWRLLRFGNSNRSSAEALAPAAVLSVSFCCRLSKHLRLRRILSLSLCLVFAFWQKSWRASLSPRQRCLASSLFSGPTLTTTAVSTCNSDNDGSIKKQQYQIAFLISSSGL